MKRLLSILLTLTALISYLPANQVDMEVFEKSFNFTLTNKILAKVNEQTITTVDLMKQLDLFFYRHNPELRKSKGARYQFYMANWQPMLNEMVQRELILADAKEKNISVSDAEVREEMQNRFGPNILENLAMVDLSYQDAREITRKQMTVERMKWHFVNHKALQKITPERIKSAYKTYCETNPPKEKWQYQIISIRSDDEKQANDVANKIEKQLSDVQLEVLEKKLPAIQEEYSGSSIQLSQLFEMNQEELSKNYKSVLETLSPNTFSCPIKQKSKASNQVVYRIFYLKDHSTETPPTFNEMAKQLKEEMISQELNLATKEYVTRLKQRFNYDNAPLQTLITENFQPFLVQ